MSWQQAYNPLGSALLSTLVAAIPIIVLLGTLAFLRLKAHWAALLGLISALLISVAIFGMPSSKAGAVAVLGAAYGLFPIGWIILNVIFLFNLANEKGHFKVLQESLTGITRDCRLQLLLIAFSFGAFFEGAAGFGTPVAVTAAILIGLGFSPLAASGLSLIANTAPVAFGALGTPMIALQGVTGLPLRALSAQTGRILPFFSVIVPFWLVWAFAGFRGMAEIWPALLVAGAFFAIPQFLISNFHGPWLVDILASILSILGLVLFLFIWHPKRVWGMEGGAISKLDACGRGDHRATLRHSRSEIIKAWLPWAILTVLVFLWGIPQLKTLLDKVSSIKVPVPLVDKLIFRMPPVVASPSAETAVFSFNWLSFTGTGIFIAAVASAFLMGYTPRAMAKTWWATLHRVRFSLLTVAAMLSLGYVMRYSGLDAAMGLTFAKTGRLYPFFGTLLGWLGVALTGSDTSSNVLFGSLQRISAEQIGLNPVLMASANSCGGVMGKMIDAQSIVVASTATRWYGHEGDILRYVFFHSLALAALVGLMVFLQAYVFPFTRLVVR
ncbi:MAG: lactate permease [Candidatus Aminicenantes bacterium RBG_16_63_16]|nr:MAG: lactate permease [Candidatus Aminicenantes bacterium RBG_16_63_16]